MSKELFFYIIINRFHLYDMKIYEGLFSNYLNLEKCSSNLYETQQLLKRFCDDDQAQKIKMNSFSYYFPKYCYSSVFYVNNFLSQRIKFNITINEKISRNKNFLIKKIINKE